MRYPSICMYIYLYSGKPKNWPYISQSIIKAVGSNKRISPRKHLQGVDDVKSDFRVVNHCAARKDPLVGYAHFEVKSEPRYFWMISAYVDLDLLSKYFFKIFLCLFLFIHQSPNTRRSDSLGSTLWVSQRPKISVTKAIVHLICSLKKFQSWLLAISLNINWDKNSVIARVGLVYQYRVFRAYVTSSVVNFSMLPSFNKILVTY